MNLDEMTSVQLSKWIDQHAQVQNLRERIRFLEQEVADLREKLAIERERSR